MKIINSDIQAIAVKPEQYPKDDLSEIAFVGRSNVGKSSFINSILNRKNLARTSGKPGKTRTINFYLINEEFRFVDLPGYGYAKVSKKEQDKWGYIIEEYLTSRENLKEIALIIDIRHSPTEQDLMMYEWIKSFGYEGIVIATKLDKISKGSLQKNLKKISEKLGMEDRKTIIPYSSINKTNLERVWERFKSLI
ncbi:MAG: ribosome biogenesis GTP-binding protein YihA/YsxC [Tissierella sp.]|uniref:ribosome biogenesis GTP-binding protein YihA/YsxC n=1 Tax=Tissierella sp. TaxID=41274 RepID=UPI003F97D6A9